MYLYLEKHGIIPSDVPLVNMPQKDLVEALISGSIDAFAASEPTPMLSLSRVSGAKELAVLSGLGNDYPLLIVTTREFADAHPEAVCAIVAGTRRAVDWINADPDATAAATAKVTGAPKELEAAMFRKMDWRVRLDQGVIDSLSQTAAFHHRTGKLRQIHDVRALSRPELCSPLEETGLAR